ncbi:hypothetical protein AVEN_198836-1, partial [Araneus ventricosus]
MSAIGGPIMLVSGASSFPCSL